MSWWSHHYNRPLKDPLLLSYTIEELSYEYFNVIERKRAEDERIEQGNDKIEEQKRVEAEKWADAMEEEEEPLDPEEKAREEAAWMQEQLRRHQEEFGGDDLSLDFGTI